MRTDDPVDDRHTEARSGLGRIDRPLSSRERGEQCRQLVGSHARAVVEYLQRHANLIRGESGLNVTIVAAVLDRIADQVVDHLRNSMFVGIE